ncbi:MAG: type II toxin-antitoxin system RelE/ParE family toxin [Chitinispirillaceae bacterium]|nr:type II toxin-antitoxin system RelE/ParE family toxin [Chitinispirillaceae bacterium]
MLQKKLLFRPEAGDLIRGSGGLRKIRWNRPGKGKRGGLRIIYCFDKPNTMYMLFVYPKYRQETLTGRQLKYLTTIMKEYLL